MTDYQYIPRRGAHAPSRQQPPTISPAVPVAKRGPGQPAGLTPIKKKNVLKALRKGNPPTVACKLAHCDRRTFHRTVAEDHEFAKAVEEAQTIADELIEHALFEGALAGNAIQQFFYLKNRRPEKWGADNGPKVLQQFTASGPKIEWSIAEARAEAAGILDELDVKRQQKELEAQQKAIDAPSREATDG